MKTLPHFLLLAAFPISLLGQGSLTPPAAPTPTMKSLDQIEARTPISSLPYTISNPGSYYLTSNLNVTTGDAITITANQVTLDLNGFTISSTASSAAGTAILLALAGGNTDITILNGHIKGGVTYNGSTYSGSGFANGIFNSTAPLLNVRVAGVSVSGCLTYGINLGGGNSTVVESCTVRTIGSYGITASSMSHSAAYLCGNYGIAATTASNCYGYSAGGIGVSAVTANDCYGQSDGSGRGLDATTAINCTSYSQSGIGLSATNASNCYGQSHGGGIGLSASNASNCYGKSDGNGDGLNATSANNCYGISNGSTGLNATNAMGCYGQSSSGNGLVASTASSCSGQNNSSFPGAYALYAYNANNCFGYAFGSGTGLNAQQIAIGSYGYSNTGTGLVAYIANSCRGETTSGSAQNVTHPYNMP